MRRIEYTGRPNPFVNIQSFVATVKRLYPGITDAGVELKVREALVTREPRVKGRTVTLLGADIMMADLSQLPAFPYLPENVISMIEMYPTETGELIDELDANAQRIVLKGKDPGRVNRLSIVSVTGLLHTYVWCHANDWTQWVHDHDYDLVLQHGRKRFRDPDRHGPYQEVRAYNPPVIERQTFTTEAVRDGEPERYVQDRRIKNYVPGADLAG